MGLQYAAGTPVDRNGASMSGYPAPLRAKATYASNNNSLSSVITVTDNTTVVEITATGAATLMRWVASTDTQASVTQSNFDHVVNSSSTRRFVIPIESGGVNSIVGINVQAGLFKRFAWISAGPIASVYGTEF